MYRVWPEPRVAERLRELIELFLTRILDARTNHLHHFFNEQWEVRSDTYTFGHDIEASWLVVRGGGRTGRRKTAGARSSRRVANGRGRFR